MHLHRKRSVLFLLVTTLLISGLRVEGQQDGDVTVEIHAKSKPETLPTLLVMCDLACTLKLDGEVKGHIDAGGSAKLKVEPGEHMVEAATEDGVDRIKQPSTVRSTGQTMVYIEFQPIRDERFFDQQQALYKAAKAKEQAEAARERAERDAPFNAERQAYAFYDQKRYGEALPLFQRACDLGRAEACGWAGYMYGSGLGTARDYSRSFSLQSKGCEAGSARDCSSIGWLYAQGKGVQKDRARAKLLFLKGCSMGDETGCKQSKKIH